MQPTQDLPVSDVLLFRLEDHTKITIRPSGTEPKLKIYLAIKSLNPSVEGGLRQCDEQLDALIAALKKDLGKS
jgi:phosphomannomutase